MAPDPLHPAYLDEGAARHEATRVFDTCNECRRCAERCPVFPTLFDLIERSDPAEAGSLTPAEQDRIVDVCFGCDRCVTDCPYTPDLDERAIDVARLMVRLDAVRQDTGQVPIRQSVVNRIAARSMFVDAVAGRARSPWRAVLSAVVSGRVGRNRIGRGGRRFSTWFSGRGRAASRTVTADPGAQRLVYPTCAIEEHDPGVGQDLVRLLERRDVECSVPDVGCCGAPWLHAGDVTRFRSIAAANVRALAADLGADQQLVLTEPMCADVIRRHYVGHVEPGLRDAAERVAERTADASADLLALGGASEPPDVAPSGDELRVVLHAGCHSPTRDVVELLRRSGIDADVVDGCCGAPGIGGVRAADRPATQVDELRSRVAHILAQAPEGAILVGDCGPAGGLLAPGRRQEHPISILARLEGIPIADR